MEIGCLSDRSWLFPKKKAGPFLTLPHILQTVCYAGLSLEFLPDRYQSNQAATEKQQGGRFGDRYF
jgi:hypothetical protein